MVLKKGHTPWNKGLKGWTKTTNAGFQEGNNLGKNRRGMKASPETLEKLRISHLGLATGEKHWNWKGGITPINEKIRKSDKYKQWRKAVFIRDNYTCQKCKARNGNGKRIVLHADHIKPFALFPELRFALNNGRTLCIGCHRKTDTYGNKKIWL